MNPEDLRAELPLTEPTFFILLSLAAGPSHGYAIMQEVAALSEGRLTLGTGTLYGALARLLDRGWVARVEPAPGDEPGRSRKDYALTPLGRQLLALETDRLRALVRVADPLLAGGGAS
jgi:DNA-binding PadR family transcriptional regulator